MRASEPRLTGNPIHLPVTSARTQIHAALMSLTPSAFIIQPTRRIPSLSLCFLSDTHAYVPAWDLGDLCCFVTSTCSIVKSYLSYTFSQNHFLLDRLYLAVKVLEQGAKISLIVMHFHFYTFLHAVLYQ